MYWRVSKLDCEDSKLPDGIFAPELYIRGDSDECVFVKFDQSDTNTPWCVMQERLTYGHTMLNRFETFNDAYKLMLEVNRSGT